MVVSHTHWDREWYEPFQRFRMRLVRLIDKLLYILEHDPDYRFFMLDGQTIVLEDYLAIRPEQEANLRRYVETGRLLIGPWHILPDEFLVSGEALVRNLLLGGRQAQAFGARMGVGYIPDPFGHISQMPQILRGFGIDCAALRRGLDDQPTEVLWQSPDGSRVLLCYLRDSYDNAARLPVRDEAAFVQEIARLHDSLAPHLTTDYALLMNGTDHMEPQPELPRALDAARRQLPDLELVHGTLPMYVAAVRQSLHVDLDRPSTAGQAKLQVVQGELRSPRRHHLLPGVLSARMWIKQRNDRVQGLLEKWAEPFAALAAVTQDTAHGLGAADSPLALIGQAWKYLLQNQPHDSICGCSIDQVHREMVTRFDWAEQIAEEVTRQSLSTLADQVNTLTEEQSGARVPLVVFNPLAAPRTDLVTASVQVPGSLEQFQVVDGAGNVVPHQVLSRKGAEFARMQLDREEVLGLAAMVEMVSGLGLAVQEIHVSGQVASAEIDVTLIDHGHTDPALVAGAQRQVEAILANPTVQTFAVRAHLATTAEFQFVADAVLGCGFKTYFLVEGRALATSAAPAGPATWHMENEFLAVDVQPDGTLTLTDKLTGLVFPGLHRLVDGGDRGDEYNYCAPESDKVISAPVAPPDITWLQEGPAHWTLQVKQTYRLPAALDADRSTRSLETVDVPITSQISLCRSVPRLDVRTELDNRAGDHRLRVHLPTPIHTDHSQAEGAFDVVRRPLGVPQDTGDWIEQPVPTHPQQSFVDVSDGQHGLLLANRGLPEYEVLPEQDGAATIALTLLRCVGWLSRDDLPCRQGHAGPASETPEAQCLGRHVFEYSLVPHAGGYLSAYTQAHAFHTPLRAMRTGEHAGTLPLQASLVDLQGSGLVLSAAKAAEAGDGLIVRFYNAGAEPAVARLRTHVPARSASLVSLAERVLQPLYLDSTTSLSVEVRGKQIVSIKLTF
jgi:alpha-mannosidase